MRERIAAAKNAAAKKTRKTASVTRIDLLPDAFTVGAPLNDSPSKRGVRYCADINVPCGDENRDYSGTDPEIQFPAGWHVLSGYPLLPYRYHQSLAPGDFQPDRVRVQEMVAWDGKKRPVVELVQGLPNRHGAAVLTRPFSHPVFWESGHTVRYLARFLFPSKPRAEHYVNIEPRGWLDFQPTAEAYDPLGMAVWDKELVVRHWSRGQNGSPLSMRETARIAHKLTLDEWHTVRFTMTPLEMTNTWDAHIEWNGQTIWQTPELFPLRGVRAFASAMFGDEQSTRKDARGGVVIVGRLAAWEIVP